MNINIAIECETINEFHSHLLKILADSYLLSYKKFVAAGQSGEFDQYDEEYDEDDNLNEKLSDDNCYGSHEVTFIIES